MWMLAVVKKRISFQLKGSHYHYSIITWANVGRLWSRSSSNCMKNCYAWKRTTTKRSNEKKDDDEKGRRRRRRNGATQKRTIRFRASDFYFALLLSVCWMCACVCGVSRMPPFWYRMAVFPILLASIERVCELNVRRVGGNGALRDEWLYVCMKNASGFFLIS